MIVTTGTHDANMKIHYDHSSTVKKIDVEKKPNGKMLMFSKLSPILEYIAESCSANTHGNIIETIHFNGSVRLEPAARRSSHQEKQKQTENDRTDREEL
jgi:hypothetical protein